MDGGAMNRLEIQYRLTPEDIAALQLHMWEKSIAQAGHSLLARLLDLARILLFGFLVLLLAGVIYLIGSEVFAAGPVRKNLLPILTCVIVLMALTFVLLKGVGPRSLTRRMARRMAIRQFRLLTRQMPEREQIVILTPEKLIEITQTPQGKLEVLLDWTFITSIDLAGRHAFFTTTNNMALILPQRAFAEERAFLDFVETAWTFHRRACELSPTTELIDSSPPMDQSTERIILAPDDRIRS